MSTTSAAGTGPPSERLALNWIDGRWADTGHHRDSTDPATGAVIGRYALAGRQDCERAISVAHQAFTTSPWRHDRALRSQVLTAMAGRFDARQEEFVQLLGAENGKVHAHGTLEMAFVPGTLRFNAALALTEVGRASEVRGGSLDLVVRQPAGVAGVIAPWNSPVALGLRSIAPALAAGATVVVSLPQQSAQVNALIADTAAGTPGLPPGVLNILTGGFDTGDALVRSPDVPVISFTGSTEVGRAISATGAEHLKRFGLELGGKTPMILFDDADLDLALPLVVSALTVFSGQFCMTGSRLLVQRGIADRVRAELVRRLEAVVVGPAADPSSEMGPLIDRANVDRVHKLVEEAIGGGAAVLTRGGPVTDGPLAVGAFYRPTALEVPDQTLPIAREEVFGPVLTMVVFDSEDDAVALANDNEYGLSAAVFSQDVDLPLRVALQLEAGTVWVNNWAVLHDQFEEGGYKASGQGRMRGLAVLDDFMEYKHIALTPGRRA